MNEKLYQLLPLIYREKDFKQQQVLRGLMKVLESAHDDMRDDIMRAYQNWFIETCETERIPFIADLVGLSELPSGQLLEAQRRFVANYLGYQRRSGTQTTLNNTISDASDFYCCHIPASQNVLTSWSAKDPLHRPKSYSCQGEEGALANTPFNRSARMASIKTLDSNKGLNSGALLPHVLQLYYWRLSPMAVHCSALTKDQTQEHAWHLSPFQASYRLCHLPKHAQGLAQPTDATLFPLALTGETLSYFWQQPTQVFDSLKFYYCQQDGHYQEISQQDIAITDLQHWHSPDKKGVKLLFDPDLGRIKLLDKSLGEQLLLSYSYLGNTAFGAAPLYREALNSLLPTQRFTSLYGDAKMLQQMLDHHAHRPLTLSIAVNTRLQLTEPLYLDLNGVDCTLFAEQYQLPVLEGDIVFYNSSAKPATVRLMGLTLLGSISLANNIHLDIDACTLVNENATVFYTPEYERQAEKPFMPTIKARSSLIVSSALSGDAHYQLDDSAMLLRNPSNMYQLTMQRCTVFADLKCFQVVLLKDSLFKGTLGITNGLESTLTHSYISQLQNPHHVNCHQVIQDTEQGVCPVRFESQRFSDSDFCLLSPVTDKTLLTGASNGEEMGVFNQMQWRQKEHNMQRQYQRFLPMGLELQQCNMD